MEKILKVFLCACICFGMVLINNTFAYAVSGTTYYVDSIKGDDSNKGTSTSTAWKTLTKVNSQILEPGDKILLKRGETFTGMFAPQGSGSSGSPITLDAYGTGKRPIISADSNPAAISLLNQEYWVIRNMETTGGNPRGISVQNSTGSMLNYFRIINCVVHDVGGTDTTTTDNKNGKKQGLITVWSENGSNGSHFKDVVIDGCSAYSTQRWAGITVSSSSSPDDTGASADIKIQNCNVTDVYGDGIEVSCARGVYLQNNVAYNIGLAPENILGTPNGIWTWKTDNAICQYNEAYQTHSSEYDGGAYDIDYYNTNNWVQYNYAHDCDGYGVAVFAAIDGQANSIFNGVNDNAIVRYNIFANNGREAGKYGSAQGDFRFVSWGGGSIDGMQIYNNTSYWNPAQNDGAICDYGTYSGTNAKIFKNNIIYSTVPKFMTTLSNSLQFDYNDYWYTGLESPSFVYNNINYTSFSSYQSESGQDAHSKFADPKFRAPGYHSSGKQITQYMLKSDSPCINSGVNVDGESRDFIGNCAPQGSAYDMGAFESPY